MAGLPSSTSGSGPKAWQRVAALVVLALFGAASTAQARNEIPIATASTGSTSGMFGSMGSGVRFHAKVRSLWEMRWDDVVRQQRDHTCAAAAVATILTHYFGFPASEEEMLQALQVEAVRDAGPDFDPTQLGYSLKHIRAVAGKGGLAAVAFKVDLRNIERIKIPVITQVTLRGQEHFVVYRSARNGRVFLADPAYGNTSYRLDAFEKIWSGVMMGFMRRNAPRPTENALSVEDSDLVRVAANDVWRRTRIDLLLTEVRGANANIPLAPEIVPGTDPALPNLILNYREFGTALSF